MVLDNLEKNHDWLLQGDVFTLDVIETWIRTSGKRGRRSAAPPASVGVRALRRY